MTTTIAFSGKSGSGKTTLVRAFLKLLRKKFQQSTILLIDNDLTLELSQSFDIKTKNTIYGVKSGKHEYKTGIPKGMSKQEYIDWALEDIIVQVDEYTDIIASWFVTPKDCNCLSTKLTRCGVGRLIDRYDFAIFDCEFDLKYLNLLTDYQINEVVVVSTPDVKEINLASRIASSSQKYAPDARFDIIINKIEKNNMNNMNLLNESGLNLSGCIKKYETIDYDLISEDLEAFYSRMNMPQGSMEL